MYEDTIRACKQAWTDVDEMSKSCIPTPMPRRSSMQSFRKDLFSAIISVDDEERKERAVVGLASMIRYGADRKSASDFVSYMVENHEIYGYLLSAALMSIKDSDVFVSVATDGLKNGVHGATLDRAGPLKAIFERLKGKAEDKDYVAELRRIADDSGELHKSVIRLAETLGQKHMEGIDDKKLRDVVWINAVTNMYVVAILAASIHGDDKVVECLDGRLAEFTANNDKADADAEDTTEEFDIRDLFGGSSDD